MRRSLAVRLPQLLLGLGLFGIGVWLCLQSHIGVAPWDVLAGGIAKQSGLSFGTVVILIGAVIVAATWLFGMRPGFGTIANMILIGVVIDRLLATNWLDGEANGHLVVRVVMVVAGVLCVGFASALYIGAHFGSGPRDSLMVVLHKRLHWSIARARTTVELIALVLGVVLGGPVGAGTLIFALGIGPAVQLAFAVLRQTPEKTTGEA